MKAAPTPEYTHLIIAARAGDRQAMNTVLAIVRPELYLFGLHICPQIAIVEDALQEASIYAFSHLHKLRDPSAFFPWMASIVKRAIWKELSASKREVALSFVDPLKDTSLESQIEEQLHISGLYESIDKLSETLRLPVMLRYFSSQNEYEQIASILGIPVGTVRSRLNQAKKQLKTLWSGGIDLPEKLRGESERWNDFYRYHFTGLFDDDGIRSSFYDHLLPSILVSFNNNDTRQGRTLVEREVSNDIQFGTRSDVTAVSNIGSLGVVEFDVVNSSEYPGRCPPQMTLIFSRKDDKAAQVRLYLF